MKKIVYFVICFFLMMNSSWAITIRCPEIASPGEKIQCNIEDDQYIGLKVKYHFDNGFTYQGLQLNSSWKSYYDGRNGFSIGNVLDVSHLSLNFGVQLGMELFTNQDYIVRFSEIEGVTTDYKYVRLDDVVSKIRVVSDVNTLEQLKISNGNLVPSFDKNITSYQAIVGSDRVVIQALPSDSGAKLDGDIGEQKLQYGANSFIIKVISERGNVKEYHLYITRTVEKNIKKSNDITLKGLTLSKGTISFKRDTFFYSTKVDYSVEDIEVKAIPNSDKAKVEIQKPDKLEIGDNLIKVIVTAEDGTIGTYIVMVNREEQLSSDATIKNLTIKGYSLKFQSDIYQYELELEDEEKLDFKVELNDNKAKECKKNNLTILFS